MSVDASMSTKSLVAQLIVDIKIVEILSKDQRDQWTSLIVTTFTDHALAENYSLKPMIETADCLDCSCKSCAASETLEM